MIKREELPRVNVDLDKERIRDIVSEALRMTYEYLGGDFTRTREDILEEVEKILATNQIATEFFLFIGSKKIPDLLIRVDPKRKEVLGKSAFKKKVAKLNHFLRIL